MNSSHEICLELLRQCGKDGNAAGELKLANVILYLNHRTLPPRNAFEAMLCNTLSKHPILFDEPHRGTTITELEEIVDNTLGEAK